MRHLNGDNPPAVTPPAARPPVPPARPDGGNAVTARQARACLGWPGCFPAGRDRLLAYADRYELPTGLHQFLRGLPGGRTWATCDQMLAEPYPAPAHPSVPPQSP